MRRPITKPSWQAVRNGIIFFGGLLGVAYETLFRQPPDYGLLPVFAAMLGLPAFIDPPDKPEPEPDDSEDPPARPAARPTRRRRGLR